MKRSHCLIMRVKSIVEIYVYIDFVCLLLLITTYGCRVLMFFGKGKEATKRDTEETDAEEKAEQETRRRLARSIVRR